MTGSDAYQLIQEALWLLLIVSAPPLLAALVVGLAISLFQALTSVQEMTLTFVPKVLVIGLVVLLTLPMMGSAFQAYMDDISRRIIEGR